MFLCKPLLFIVYNLSKAWEFSRSKPTESDKYVFYRENECITKETEEINGKAYTKDVTHGMHTYYVEEGSGSKSYVCDVCGYEYTVYNK